MALAACAFASGIRNSAAKALGAGPEHVTRGGGGGSPVAVAAAAVPARRSLLESSATDQPLQSEIWTRRLTEDSATVGGSSSSAKKRCPQLSQELLHSRAINNTVMLAVANDHQWDFGLNWLHHIKKAGIQYYVVAAADVPTSERLTALGEPCFEWIDEEIPKLGLDWGQEGWRRMTWTKVFIVDALVDWGLNLVVSDLDVVWFRDAAPLLDQYPHADLIFSTDGTRTDNPPGDGGLDIDGSPYHDFNTGVYLLRYSNATATWVHAWRAFYDNCTSHDQVCAYNLMRTGEIRPHPQEPRVQCGFNGTVWVGILPSSLAMNAHTLFLQKLHKIKKVDPYVVHLTWTYNGTPGKRSRMRDLGLWADPPEYYNNGSFVTVDLQLPEAPPNYNQWNENEDMISFHLELIHAQLQQAYVGMALAQAAGRAFILPQFVCYCEKIWYSVVRCRVVSAQDMELPVTCPQDYLFEPGHYDDNPQEFGPALDLREGPFLQSERTPAEVKESVVTIQPSAALECSDCVKEEAGPDGQMVVLVPPALCDSKLLPLLEPYKRFRVWRFSFEGVGDTQRAYGGFADVKSAQQFDRRMEHITTIFCCRRAEEAPRYHRDNETHLVLSMTSEFSYSRLLSSSSSSTGGGGEAGAQTRRQRRQQL